MTGHVVAIVVCWYAVRWADHTDSLPPLPVSPPPDPYEVAYLRGGKAEVARLAVLALIEEGSLEVRESVEYHWYGNRSVWMVEQSPGRAQPEGEPRFLGTVLGWFSSPRRHDEVYDIWLKDLKGVYADFDERFRSQSLVRPLEVENIVWTAGLIATIAPAGLLWTFSSDLPAMLLVVLLVAVASTFRRASQSQ